MVTSAAPHGRGALAAALAGGAGLLAAMFLAGEAPPPIVLLGPVGLVAVAALADVRIAMVMLIASGPLELGLDLGLGETLTAGKLAGLVAFTSFAFDAIRSQRTIRLDRTHVSLLLLLAVALIATPGARSPAEALSTSLRYGAFVGLYVVLTQFRHEHRLLRRLVWALTIATAAVSLQGLANFAAGDTTLARPSFADPNDFAFVVATTMPLAFWLLTRSTARRRLLATACLAAMGAGVVLSFSRGALLALAVGMVWHAATERRHLPVLVAGGVVAATAALLFVNAQAERVEAGLDSKSRIAQENVETRLDAWEVAAQLAVERPLTGVGPGNFGSYYFERTGRPPGTFQLQVVHNTYLDVAAELGLVGMSLFLFFLGAAAWRATVATRRRLGPPGLAPAVRTALVVALVGGITLSEQYFPPFWVLGAIATLLWAEGHDRAERRTEQANAPEPAATS